MVCEWQMLTIIYRLKRGLRKGHACRLAGPSAQRLAKGFVCSSGLASQPNGHCGWNARNARTQAHTETRTRTAECGPPSESASVRRALWYVASGCGAAALSPDWLVLAAVSRANTEGRIGSPGAAKLAGPAASERRWAQLGRRRRRQKAGQPAPNDRNLCVPESLLLLVKFQPA